MPAVRYSDCCDCIDLRTRCIIIGYVELVLEAIGCCCLLYLVAGGYWLGSDLAVQLVLLLLVSLMLTFTITFLVGLHKNKRSLVKVYLYFSCVSLVVRAILEFMFILRQFNMSDFVGLACGIFLQIYILVVIHNYYEQMDMDGSPGITAPTPGPATPLLAEI